VGYDISKIVLKTVLNIRIDYRHLSIIIFFFSLVSSIRKNAKKFSYVVIANIMLARLCEIQTETNAMITAPDILIAGVILID